MEALFNPMAWGSPLGLGIFLICLGIFIFLVSVVDKKNKK